MKNKFKIIVLLTIGFSVVISCMQKDEVVLSQEELAKLEIKEARKFYEEQFNLTTESIKTELNTNDHKSKRHLLEKSLNWGKAYTKIMESGLIGVYVPVLYVEDNFFLKGKWAWHSLSGLTYVLIYEKEKGKKSLEIVTTFPDTDYLSANKRPELFSGIVYVEDWNGKFIKSIRHREGKMFLLKELASYKQSLTEICSEIIDWYTCTSYGCNYNYSEIIYFSCDGNSGGDMYCSSCLNYEPSGGSVSTTTDISVDCNCDICPVCGGCLETTFKKVPADDGSIETSGGADCPTCSCVPIVDVSGLEKNAKAKCIYDKLINGGILKDFISRYYPSASTTSPLGELNLTWTLGSSVEGSSSEIFPIGVPRNGIYNSVEIRLNESILNSSSVILAATTMLHEALHAKLIAEVYDIVGTTDFKTLYAYYAGWGLGNIDANQEMEMLDSYTSQMAKALQKYDQSQGVNNTVDFYKAALYYSFCIQLELEVTTGDEEFTILYNASKICN